MKTLLKLFTLLFCVVSFSQSTIKGKVTDNTGLPLPGANIVVVGTTTGAFSDFEGNYTLSTDQNPPFSIRISYTGFETQTIEVTNNSQTIDVQLAEGNALDEIVVSASRTPERIRESPVSIERLDIRAIKNSSSPSFYDSLENLKGVDINTSSLTFKSVNTRGFAAFANERFVQLVDGMDNASPALNFPLGNLLGLSELDVNSVELLPGASSALYGANAFNGILFMTSKNPFDHPGISAYGKLGLTSSDNAGDNSFVDAGIRAAYKFSDKFAAKASFSFLSGTEWHATDTRDFTNPGLTRADTNYNGLNVYGDFFTVNLDLDAIAAGALPIPVGTNYGSFDVSRTGYEERDLLDYDAESVKADFSLHYKPWANDFEVIWNSKIGRGNTIYQGGNRYSINNFTMQQHKLEVRSDNFFVRGYTIAEKAGDSYDTTFTGVNINRLWKSDQQWFQDYAAGFLGATALQGIFSPNEEQLAAAHAAARANADTGRFEPGTPEFQRALDQVTNDGDLRTGSRFIDNSKIYHADVNYNFGHLIDFAEIQVGGSWREFELNSQGTIYTDISGPINYNNFGVYTQIQKKFMEDKLKFTGSVRYDKQDFSDGSVSPRLALVYSPSRNHNFRGSFQTGFRNPATQDLFIGLNIGPLILVGSAEDNLDATFDIPLATDPSQSVTISGRDFYNTPVFDADTRAVSTIDLVEPERVSAFEVGYRGVIKKFNVDVSVYYNTYNDFIVNDRVLVPLFGSADTDNNPATFDSADELAALQSLSQGNFQAIQVYTNANETINSYGGSLGIDTKLNNGLKLGVNYTYADFDADADTRTNFNTPEHKVKGSIGHDKLFKNFGFNVNWRWNDSYLWQAGFADGNLPARHTIDAQMNYTIPSLKSIIKVGASNLLGHEYVSAPGAGVVGSQFFVSWTIN